MIKTPSREIIEARKSRYKKGLRVELINMEDPYTDLASGDKGTVSHVDDIGSIHVNWDKGSKLALVDSVDEFKVLPTITDDILKSILVIRDSGRTNMFDVTTVYEIAVEMGFYDLMVFIEEHKTEYCHFILTGEKP